MKQININGISFRQTYSAQDITTAVKQIAEQISSDYAQRSPLFICVLNGAFIFAADLLRHIDLHCHIDFIRLKSYEGTQTTGQVIEILGLKETIQEKDIIIIEDIVDTGTTIHYLKQQLFNSGAASVKVCTMLFKPDSLQFADAQPDYIGISIKPSFCIGYGLDIDGLARNLEAIYTAVDTD